MNKTEKILLASSIVLSSVLLSMVVSWSPKNVEAQGSAPTPPVSFLGAASGSTLANCGTPTVPSLCIVASGVYAWQSSTTGWFLLAPQAAAAGVTSWNGQTGVVTYTPPPAPVTSVNGKTGAVVLGATATAATVTIQ